MYVSWEADVRPVWWVRGIYRADIGRGVEEWMALTGQVEEVLAATGAVRAPRVTWDGAWVTVTFRIKADGLTQAVDAATA